MSNTTNASAQPATTEPVYTCSYCDELATRVGSGQDGDFYCDEHRNLAPGATESIED